MNSESEPVFFLLVVVIKASVTIDLKGFVSKEKFLFSSRAAADYVCRSPA